jgi:TPR repeat protein
LAVEFAGFPGLAGPDAYNDLPCASGINTRDIKGLLNKAKKGDPQAQLVVGCACEYGVGMAMPDRAQAMDWYQKAAEAGLVPAQHFLGEAYLRNFDYVQAYKWLKIAELGGHKGPSGANDDPQHPDVKSVALLLSTDELKKAEEETQDWHRQHGGGKTSPEKSQSQ